MSEFDDIFADPLTTMVYLYASIAVLAAYAVVAFALMRRRLHNPRFNLSRSNRATMAKPALAQLRGRYPN